MLWQEENEEAGTQVSGRMQNMEIQSPQTECMDEEYWRN
jgi:hypothetical protein